MTRKRLFIILTCLLLAGTTSTSASAAYKFGNKTAGIPRPGALGPLAQIQVEAQSYANLCPSLTANKLVALTLPPTWTEGSGGNGNFTPHPMMLGRSDAYYEPNNTTIAGRGENRGWNQRLYYNEQLNESGHQRIFWHPGDGMWQLDDAGEQGLGRRMAGGKWFPYKELTKYIAERYCKVAPNVGAVYGPGSQNYWVSCGAKGSTCTAIFNQIYDPAADKLKDSVFLEDQNVDVFEGLELRRCHWKDLPQRSFQCLYIDAGLADHDPNEVYDFWQSAPQGGADGHPLSPLSRPFYVVQSSTGGEPAEYRIWLDEDIPLTGTDVMAVRGFKQGSRAPAGATPGLKWTTADSQLCDETKNRGRC